MLTLASFKYRDVTHDVGGPVEKIEGCSCTVAGRPLYTARAFLREDLVGVGQLSLYDNADGCGTHAEPVVARHIAISEAMERWAFYSTVSAPDRAKYGFDVDETTTGMAAFPGITARMARRSAYLEAIERYCLRNWWEGNLDAREIDTDWPGVKAAVIEAPGGGFTVVTFRLTDEGNYAYGYGSDVSLGAAIEHGLIEMHRHEAVIRRWHRTGRQPSAHIWERRAVFFSTLDGYRLFRARLTSKAARRAPKPEIVADCEVPGDWSRYAGVWRVAIRPPSDKFLTAGEDYFFW